MNSAPVAIRMLSRTRVLSRSATVIGTRKSAMVRPRSAAVERSSLGMAIVIWAPRSGVTRAVTGRPILAGRQSYWTARTIDRRLAMRAG